MKDDGIWRGESYFESLLRLNRAGGPERKAVTKEVGRSLYIGQFEPSIYLPLADTLGPVVNNLCHRASLDFVSARRRNYSGIHQAPSG